MKKILIAIALMIAVLSGHVIAQESKGPKISAKAVQFDSGNVVQGIQVSHVFEISNSGSEVLIIERVQPS